MKKNFDEGASGGRGMGPVRGILFDLDGTLLDVEMREFIPAYIRGLGECFTTQGETFRRVVLAATLALLHRRDGETTNEAAFLSALEEHLGLLPEDFARGLERFCREGLEGLAPYVRPFPLARPIVQTCFARGWKVALATNPVFPRPVVDARLRWGGLEEFPFHHVTTFENSSYCKPDPRYFQDVLASLGLAPEECLMVGNDTEHDLAAQKAGIRTYLVDTCLIDRAGGHFAADYRGGHEELLCFLGAMEVKGRDSLT